MLPFSEWMGDGGGAVEVELCLCGDEIVKLGSKVACSCVLDACVLAVICPLVSALMADVKQSLCCG